MNGIAQTIELADFRHDIRVRKCTVRSANARIAQTANSSNNDTHNTEQTFYRLRTFWNTEYQRSRSGAMWDFDLKSKIDLVSVQASLDLIMDVLVR